MNKLNSTIFEKTILMISDYEDLSGYYASELLHEQNLISDTQKGMKRLGIEFEYVEVKSKRELISTLKNFDRGKTVVFNWCEKLTAKDTGQIAIKALEKSDFCFTGADSKLLALTDDKVATKRVLSENDIETPKYWPVKNTSDLGKYKFTFPAIVKYADLHGSFGIGTENVVGNISDLQNVAKRLLSKGSLIVEEFIEGNEYSVAVWGNSTPTILPIVHVNFGDKNIFIQTEKSKFNYESNDFMDIRYEFLNHRDFVKIKSQVGESVLGAYTALGFKDYGRFELRIRKGSVYILDANANPALSYDCVLLNAAQRLGYNTAEAIAKMCEFALERQTHK